MSSSSDEELSGYPVCDYKEELSVLYRCELVKFLSKLFSVLIRISGGN